MAVRSMRLDATCPACGQRSLNYTSADLDIPHFPNSLQLVFVCGECGFRHTDFLIGTTREPTRTTLEVRGAEDLDARVVRSTSGTIRIQELGVLIEPGPASDAYVSNVEGVLARVEAILVQLGRDAETDEARRACEARLGDLKRARDGAYPFTFVLEDPYGNSAVVHDAARVESLPAEEASALKTGEFTLDLQQRVAQADLSGNGGTSSNGV